MRRDGHSIKTHEVRVIGVGYTGILAVESLISSKLQDIQFISIDTDRQTLEQSNAPTQILIGNKATQQINILENNLIAEHTLSEASLEIKNALKGARILYITAGLGGFTGSRATPVIAKLARELGIITIAVATGPVASEGNEPTHIAKRTIKELETYVDYLIVLPTDHLVTGSPEHISQNEPFQILPNLLCQSIQVVNEFVNHNGLINLDLSDFKHIMNNRGTTLITIGRAAGEERARFAAERALFCPYLGLSIHGARGLLVNTRASSNLNLQETNTITQIIKNSTFPGAEFIIGIIIDEKMGDEIKVSVIATGFFNENWGIGPQSGDRSTSDG
jgi:cell division protein FtsZ